MNFSVHQALAIKPSAHIPYAEASFLMAKSHMPEEAVIMQPHPANLHAEVNRL
jgi:hypothetical protein